MIPEIEVTCSGKRYFINSITVEQYKKYVSLMEKNSTEKISGVMFFNTKIMQELFENELTLAEIGEIDAIDFLTAIKTVHFVMQNIIAEKLLNIIDFFVQNARTIGIVYVVGAVVVFLAMTVFYIWVDRVSKKEQELYYDEYYYPDDEFAERMSVVVWFILSLGCAILWVGILRQY